MEVLEPKVSKITRITLHQFFHLKGFAKSDPLDHVQEVRPLKVFCLADTLSFTTDATTTILF